MAYLYNKIIAGYSNTGRPILSPNATGNITASSLSITNPNLIVFRYQFNGTSDDAFHAWLNPTADTDLPSISVTLADISLTALEIRSFNSFGNVNFDEIRFGTTFADVVPVPEPSSALLLFFGVGAAVWLVKRRQVTL